MIIIRDYNPWKLSLLKKWCFFLIVPLFKNDWFVASVGNVAWTALSKYDDHFLANFVIYAAWGHCVGYNPRTLSYVKSWKLIWNLDPHRWNLWVPDLQTSCSDLTRKNSSRTLSNQGDMLYCCVFSMGRPGVAVAWSKTPGSTPSPTQSSNVKNVRVSQKHRKL